MKTKVRSFIHGLALYTLMTKFKVFNILVFKLEHFENDLNFCKDIYYTVTLRSDGWQW